MGRPLKLLLVEDIEADAGLIVGELAHAGFDVTHRRVSDAPSLREALTGECWDLVTSGYSMPMLSGTEALDLAHRLAPDTPFIFVSGTIGEDAAVAAMHAGAMDYVMKGNLRRLAPAVERELADADIRRRQRVAEEELRTTSEILRSVFAASPVAIIATDLSWKVRLWNPAAERMFGWTAQEVVGLDDPSIPAGALDEIASRRQRALRGEPLTDVESKRLRKDGSSIDVSISVAPRFGAAGEPEGLTVLRMDISARKSFEAQFLQAQKMEVVGRLAGGVAHDFNNLLTVISSCAELLENEMPHTDKRLEDVTEIRHAAAAATALTRQLLSFSRQKVTQPAVVGLNAVVTEALKLLKRIVGSGVKLTTDLDPVAGSVLVDPGQLEQLIMNLGVNARDAMEGGGTLTVATRHAAATELDEGDASNAPFGYGMISIRDTGSGIDPETQAKMFQPFFTTKPVDRGTGLGLSTVQSIVRQHRGAIEVESAVRAGTTFRVYFPTANE